MTAALSTAPIGGGVRKRTFLLLTAMGLAGCLLATPALLQALRALVARSPVPPPIPVGALYALQVVQVLVFIAVAAVLGLWASARAGLEAPLFAARARGEPVARLVLQRLPRALLWGGLVSLAILALNAVASPWLPEALRAASPLPAGASLSQRLGAAAVGATSAFYGGIVEELLMRWALMSLLVVGALKLGLSRPAALWTGNVLAALLFGAGHLPVALGLAAPSPLLVGYILLGNGLGGVVFGWLFARRGLEQAMLAHAVGDVGLHALPLLVL